MYDLILYAHVLAASAWIGGAIILFGMGIYIRDKEAQTLVYYYIGPFYGYFETLVLIILLSTGLYFFYVNDFWYLITDSTQELGKMLQLKIVMVSFITLSTMLHMYISLKAHGRERSLKEKLVSRATSLAIFLLNLIILWSAIQIRSIL